jgi:dTDP-glucose 4,6-dehydratase
MRILVTGSLGTIGRPLVRRLRSLGHEVHGVDLRHSADEYEHRADVSELRQLAHVFALVEPSFGEAAADRLDEGLTERQVILHPNDYALSKWVGERQILSFARRRPELEAMRLRFFNAYGPGEMPHAYRSVVALFCDLALRGEPLPVFENYFRTFMHLEDFVPTLASVCASFAPGMAVNIGGRDYRSVHELAEIVIEHAGSGRIDLVGEDRHNTRSKRPDIGVAEDLLGHDPTITLEQGVPGTLEWIKDNVYQEA